jgi:hypothetical protein
LIFLGEICVISLGYEAGERFAENLVVNCAEGGYGPSYSWLILAKSIQVRCRQILLGPVILLFLGPGFKPANHYTHIFAYLVGLGAEAALVLVPGVSLKM